MLPCKRTRSVCADGCQPAAWWRLRDTGAEAHLGGWRGCAGTWAGEVVSVGTWVGEEPVLGLTCVGEAAGVASPRADVGSGPSA